MEFLKLVITVPITRKCLVLISVFFVLINTWTPCSATDQEQEQRRTPLSSVVFRFNPPVEIYVYERQEVSLSFSVETNTSLVESDDSWTNANPPGTLFVRAVPAYRIHLIENAFKVDPNEFLTGFNRTLEFKGLFLGHATLEFYFEVTRNESSQVVEKTSRAASVATAEPATPSVVATTATPAAATVTSNTSGLEEKESAVLETNAPFTVQPKNAAITKNTNSKPKEHNKKRATAVDNTPINEEEEEDECKGCDFVEWLRRRAKRETLSSDHFNSIAREPLILGEFKVHVLRKHGMLDAIFMIIVGIFVVINITMMGCEIELPIVYEVLKKPIGPAVGFVSQFAFMPLASYGLGQAFLQESNLQLGLFTLGCSPGGNGSNFWTLILNGDINLSVTMTFISTLSAIFMMPLWMYTLGQTIITKGNISIPFLSLMTSLVTFCIPVSIGVAIRHYRPNWASVARKIIRPLTIVLVIVANVFAIFTSTYLFTLMTWRILLCGLCVGWGGYAFGALLAWLFRLSRPQIIAVSIETAIQNAGIAFMVLTLTLKQPDADLSSAAPIAQLMVTGFPLLFCYLIYKAAQKIKGCLRRKENHQVEERQKDIDAVEPLVINRTSVSPPSYVKKTVDSGDKSNLHNKEQLKLNNVVQKSDTDVTAPIYANMYQDFDEKYYTNAYAKPHLQLKLSYDGESKYDVPKFQMRTFEEEVGSDESDDDDDVRQSINQESNV